MHSALYTGSVRHRRFSPRQHDFRYHMAYFYLDLSETERLFRFPLLMAQGGPSILAFRRRDYFAHSDSAIPKSESLRSLGPLDESIRQLVKEKLGRSPLGPIRVLTQLSYFGFCFNPVSFYYCFNEADSRVEFIVADVTNTPWKERHPYVVACTEGEPLDFGMNKAFHVSPFMPMEISYRWRLSAPGEFLGVHMESLTPASGELVFDATMSLRRRKLNLFSVAVTLLTFPLLTIKAVLAIYYEAVRLKLKGLSFFPHPPAPKTGERR